MTTPSMPSHGRPYVPINQLAAQLGRPIRVAIFARRSKDDPHTKSFQVQVDKARAYLTSLPSGTWECDFRDADAGGDIYAQVVSAWKDDGEHALLHRILGQLAAYDLVLVYRFDRLSRRTRVALAAIHTMQQADVRLYSVTENLDSANPNDYLLTTLMFGMAQQASDDTSARIRGSKAFAKNRGGWRGGVPLYGYRVAMAPLADGTVASVRDAHGYKTLEHDPTQVAHLRAAITEIADHGQSVSAVVRDLNDPGVPSPRGIRLGEDGSRVRIDWSVAGLRRILTNPALQGFDVVGVGKARFKILVVDGHPHRPHPPVVSDSRWDQLQVALRGWAGVRRVSGEALLRGIVRCAANRVDGTICGQPLYGPGTPDGPTASYACRVASKHGAGDPRRCTGNAVSARWIEQMTVTTVRLIADTQ